MRRPTNIPVVSVDHHQAGLTQRFRMDGLAESTRAFQCWFLGLAKVELRELSTIAEADQFSSVVQVAYKIEDTGTLDRNQSHGLDLRGIRDLEDSEPGTVFLFHVKIGIAIGSPIQEERLPWSLGHLRKIRWFDNDLIPGARFDLRLSRYDQQKTRDSCYC